MASVGNTYYSRDYGATFLVSDGSTYVDTYKPPAPVSVIIEDGSAGVDITVTFNRAIDKDTEELGSWSAILNYLNINALHEVESFPAESDPYKLSVYMQILEYGHLGGDVISYQPDGINEILGTNGIGTGSWSIRTDDYPNPQTAILNVDGPDIEVLVNFNIAIDTSQTIDTDNISMVFHDFEYSLTEQNYPSSTQWRTVWTKEGASTGDFFRYEYTSGVRLASATGISVRMFEFFTDNSSTGVTINE